MKKKKPRWTKKRTLNIQPLRGRNSHTQQIYVYKKGLEICNLEYYKRDNDIAVCNAKLAVRALYDETDRGAEEPLPYVNVPDPPPNYSLRQFLLRQEFFNGLRGVMAPIILEERPGRWTLDQMQRLMLQKSSVVRLKEMGESLKWIIDQAKEEQVKLKLALCVRRSLERQKLRMLQIPPDHKEQYQWCLEQQAKSMAQYLAMDARAKVKEA